MNIKWANTSFTEFQKKVIHLLVQIRNAVNNPVFNNSNQLSAESPSYASGQLAEKTSSFFIEVCESLDDLEVLEEQLKDRAVRRNLVRILQNILVF